MSKRKTSKALKYYHTVKYLKPSQIYYRIWNYIYHPKPDLSQCPPLREPINAWGTPASKAPSLLGPSLFHFLNQEHSLEIPTDWNNPSWDKLWLYNLHYFDDLNADDWEKRKDWHQNLIQRWIDENPLGIGNGWEPYPISLRIVNWIKWHLVGNNLSDTAIHSLAAQTRFLRRRLESHLLGNHFFANAKALVYAGLFFSGKEAEEWSQKGLSILKAETKEQILSDGGHFERSPMYHAIILEDMLDLINIMRTYGRDPSDYWLDAAKHMLHFLTALCHPDQQISLFNDSAFGIAAHPNDIASYATRLGFQDVVELSEGITHLEDTGYIRWQRGDAVAYLDIGEIGPDYIPGHAHADTLTFEFSLYDCRLIVDSGTSCYGESSERIRQRGTSAHNTVTIDDENSSEVWGAFRIARRARPIGLKIENDFVRCGHDGYCRLGGKPIHIREWRLGNNNFLIRDVIEGGFREASGHFHFHSDIRLTIDKNGQQGTAMLSNKHAVKFNITGGYARVINTTYHPEFGLSIPNKCIEVTFMSPICETVFSWL